MNHQKEKYPNCFVLGVAIKLPGEILKPFVTDTDLVELIDSIVSKEELCRWYPLKPLLSLFEIAEKNGLVEKLGKAAGTDCLRPLVQMGGITTPKQVITVIEQGLPKQHQGDIGHFSLRMIDNASAELMDGTYAPCGYFVSLLERAISGFGAVDIVIDHHTSHCRKDGGHLCQYTLSWKESALLKFTKTPGPALD